MKTSLETFLIINSFISKFFFSKNRAPLIIKNRGTPVRIAMSIKLKIFHSFKEGSINHPVDTTCSITTIRQVKIKSMTDSIQNNYKAGSTSQSVVHPYFSSVQVHDFLCNAETETDMLLVFVGFVTSVKAVKYSLLL